MGCCESGRAKYPDQQPGTDKAPLIKPGQTFSELVPAQPGTQAPPSPAAYQTAPPGGGLSAEQLVALVQAQATLQLLQQQGQATPNPHEAHKKPKTGTKPKGTGNNSKGAGGNKGGKKIGNKKARPNKASSPVSSEDDSTTGITQTAPKQFQEQEPPVILEKKEPVVVLSTLSKEETGGVADSEVEKRKAELKKQEEEMRFRIEQLEKEAQLRKEQAEKEEQEIRERKLRREQQEEEEKRKKEEEKRKKDNEERDLALKKRIRK